MGSNLDTFRKIIILLFGAACVVAAIVLAFNANYKGCGFMIVLTAVCFLLGDPSLLKKFKLGGKWFALETELKDTIDEAKDIITRIRALVLPLAELGFILEKRSTYIFSQVPREDHLRLEHELDQALQGVGASNSEIEQRKMPLHESRRLNLINTAINKIGPFYIKKKEEHTPAHVAAKREHGDNSPEAKSTLEAVHAPEHERTALRQLLNGNVVPKYEDIVAHIKSSAVFSDDEQQEVLEKCKEELDDVQHYELHNELRRPEVWKNQNL